jgi:glucokinase
MDQESTSQSVLAIDLGGTNLRAALVQKTGTILAQLKRETPKADDVDALVEALTSAAHELDAKVEDDLVSVAIMVPGRVDLARMNVVQAPNLPCLDNFPLKQVLEEKLLVPVLLENDANAAAVGEMWMGAARGARNVICITLGTGVGGRSSRLVVHVANVGTLAAWRYLPRQRQL